MKDEFHCCNSDMQKTEIHKNHCNISWQLYITLNKYIFRIAQPGDDPAAKQCGSTSWSSPSLHTGNTNSPRLWEWSGAGAPWQSWVMGSTSHSASRSHRLHGTMRGQQGCEEDGNKSWQEATKARFKTFLPERISLPELRNWHISFHVLL